MYKLEDTNSETLSNDVWQRERWMETMQLMSARLDKISSIMHSKVHLMERFDLGEPRKNSYPKPAPNTVYRKDCMQPNEH